MTISGFCHVVLSRNCKRIDQFLRISWFFLQVFPENYLFGKRPPIPLFMKRISIVVGEPMVFDMAQLKRDAKTITAKLISRSPIAKDFTTSNLMGSSIASHPMTSSDYSTCMHVDPRWNTAARQTSGEESPTILDEYSLKWMYSHMSETIRTILEDLVAKAKCMNKIHA